MKKVSFITIALIFIAQTAFAGNLDIPNTFVSGTTAQAAEVNDNFTEVENEVNDNDSRVTTNSNDISTNTANISTNTSNISTNTSDISTNTSNIAANTSDISPNTSNITSNSNDIATAQSDIGTNTGDITTNASDITTNQGSIAINSTNIATNTTDIANNTASINAIPSSFNPQYPDGLTGIVPIQEDISSPYTVPAGKNLHILNCAGVNFIVINGLSVIVSNSTLLPQCPHVIAGEGDVVSEFYGTPFLISGYLVNTKVTPITFQLDDSQSTPVTYTVPAGKNFFLLKSSNSFVIDGIALTGSNSGRFRHNNLSLIAGSGMVLSAFTNELSVINGYLADQ